MNIIYLINIYDGTFLRSPICGVSKAIHIFRDSTTSIFNFKVSHIKRGGDKK